MASLGGPGAAFTGIKTLVAIEAYGRTLIEVFMRQFAQVGAPGQPGSLMQESGTENAGLRHQERGKPQGALGSARQSRGLKLWLRARLLAWGFRKGN
jgi:hypothetical protein